MFKSPALAAQKILVLEVIEENWDTLPGQFLEKHRLGPIPEEYRNKRVAEGKELWGCYEDDMARLYGWQKSHSIDEILKTYGKSVSPNTKVLVWWRIQFKGHYRCSERINWFEFEKLPIRIEANTITLGKRIPPSQPKRMLYDPGRIENSGEFLPYRFASPLEILSFNDDGALILRIGKDDVLLSAGEAYQLSDIKKLFMAKDLKVSWLKQSGLTWLADVKPEPYEFRTKLSITNYGAVDIR